MFLRAPFGREENGEPAYVVKLFDLFFYVTSEEGCRNSFSYRVLIQTDLKQPFIVIYSIRYKYYKLFAGDGLRDHQPQHDLLSLAVVW